MATEGDRAPRLLTYYLAQGLCMGSLASVITLLGDLRDEFGLSETQVGLIVGAGFLTAFVTQLTLARVADRGHAPLMVRIGLMAAAASMIGFAASTGFWTMLVSRGALGVAIGVAQPAIRRNVILADPAHTGRNLGRLGVIEVVGFAATPAVTALLADAFNLDVPFYVLAAVATATVLTMGRLEPDESARGTRTTSSLQLLRDRVVAGTLLLVTSQFVMIGAWEAVWAVSLVDLGAATWEVGLSITLFAIPLGALAPVAGAWAQRTGGLWLCVAGMTGSAAAGVLLGLFDSVWTLVGLSMLMAVGGGLGFTAGLYAYSQTVPDDRQASSQGLMGAFEVLLAGLTSVLGAWLYDIAGRVLVWTVIPALTVLAVAAGVVWRGVRTTDGDRPPTWRTLPGQIR
ncbi:MAG: MFS transporter [Acidimicrobiaceae bacterium]|nr:MFS transporter [Acidimicrobiaceae bacterium]